MERRTLSFGGQSQNTDAEKKPSGFRCPCMVVPQQQEVSREFFRTPFTSGFC